MKKAMVPDNVTAFFYPICDGCPYIDITCDYMRADSMGPVIKMYSISCEHMNSCKRIEAMYDAPCVDARND